MSATQPATASDVRLEVLYDASQDPDDLPLGLRRRYGGGLRLKRPSLYANFVSSVDGVVALEMKHAPGVISQRSQADRFVMGLLRAHADAVLIGGATMRADPGHEWTAEYIYPDAANDFRELRSAKGQPEHPRLVVLTASGRIDPKEPALDGALVLTSKPLTGTHAEVRVLDDMTPRSVSRVLADEGLEVVLSEGGPALFGAFVSARLVDELFLTVSPVVVGSDEDGRKVLSSGMALPNVEAMDLVSVRRYGSHLFTRYRL